MPSAIATEKVFSDIKVNMYDHDPAASTAVICSPDGGTTKRTIDMSLYDNFAVVAGNQALTGAGINLLEIVAAENAAMTTNLTVIKTSGAVVADALDDFVVLECSAEEISQLGNGLRYAAARITMANAADEAKVVYIGYAPKTKTAGLTATYIS